MKRPIFICKIIEGEGAAVGGYLFVKIYINNFCNTLKTIQNAQNFTPAVRDYP